MESYLDIAQSFAWEPIQLSSGPLDLELHTLDTQTFGLFEMRFAPKVHDKTVVRKGYVCFCLLCGQCSSLGMEIEPPTLAVLPDTLEFRTTFEPAFHCIEIFLKTGVVQDHALGEWALSPRRTKRELTVPVSDTGAATFSKLFYKIMSELPEDADPNTLAMTEQTLLDMLYAVLSAHRELVPPERRSRSRTLLVERALKVLDDPDVREDASSLAKKLRVSRRTLELAFQSVIGISPGRFMLAQRLNRVRNALDSDKGGVIEIAAKSGFEHPSRFSYQYKRLFEELPSETLERARNRLAQS